MKKSLTLNSGYQMPTLGLGTWRSKNNEVAAAVKYALAEANYTHVDCASIYGNQKEIGQAFHEVFSAGEVKRNDIFVTSKLWGNDHHPDDVEKACRQTLADLQLEYLDLYLIHWGLALPRGGELEPMENGMVKTAQISTEETWQAMEKLVEKGLVKSIGVANFTVTMLLDLLTYAKIKPAVNQVEIHPYNTQVGLVKFCQNHDIAVTAYSPLGSSNDVADKPIKNKVVLALAQKYTKTPAQILLRFALQRNLIAIPKSTNPERVKENLDIFDFELDETAMTQLGDLNQNHRYVDPITWWGLPYFA